jgi:menaquinone-dependent protoporphyrinogen oxidase
MKILVAYATAHGSTAEVARFMQRVLRVYDAQVDCHPVDAVQSLEGYDAVILGSAVQEGMWLREAGLFLERFAEGLKTTPLYLFITCVRVLEQGGLEHVLKYYIHQRALEGMNVRDTTAFSGKLDMSAVNWEERWTLSLRYDGKEMPGNLSGDFRDWRVITSWVNKIGGDLQLKPVFTP